MRNDSRNTKKRTSHFALSESDGLQAGDGVGNRQKFSESRINADDIGNRLPASESNIMVRDDIGNSIGGAPTHEQSGVMASFEGRGRRRRESSQERSNGSHYIIGGVNPLVSGNQALFSMFSTPDEIEDEGSEKLPPKIPSPLSEPAPRQNRNAGARGEDPRSGKKNEKAFDSSDRWLKRLLELDDDERQESGGQGDPKQKAALARAALGEIFERAGVMAAIGTEIITDEATTKSTVLVSFEDIDMHEDAACRLSNVFAKESISLLALNFLLNKIVNRNPEERVRVQVSLRGSKEQEGVSS